MHMMFEESDYDDVRNAVSYIIRFVPTNEQIDDRVFSNAVLVADAYKWDWADTEVRADLCEALDPGYNG